MDVSNDTLFKVRPLLNALKITFPCCLELGDETKLDEASVDSRSRYGGDVISYNPTKYGGKFNFRFNLIFCSTSYACVRIWMHTRNMSDVGDGYNSPEAGGRKKKVDAARLKTTGLPEEDTSDED